MWRTRASIVERRRAPSPRPRVLSHNLRELFKPLLDCDWALKTARLPVLHVILRQALQQRVEVGAQRSVAVERPGELSAVACLPAQLRTVHAAHRRLALEGERPAQVRLCVRIAPERPLEAVESEVETALEDVCRTRSSP